MTLSQRSTYILPTGLGFFMGLILLLMLVGATNYQNNLAFLLTFLVAGIGLVSMIFTYQNIQGIQFSLINPGEVFVGETLPLPISLRSINRTKHFSIGIGLDKKNVSLVDVPDDNYVTLKVDVKAVNRGRLELPRITVMSVFPFGWLRTWAYFRFDTDIIVYPEPLEPARLDTQNWGQESEEGSRVEGSEDLYGLKPYQDGEPLTRVDWKSYARERGMFIREFAAHESADLCLNWEDFPGVDNETRLSYLTYMVLEASSNQLNFSLELPDKFVEYGEGDEHRKKCLKALALFGEAPQASGTSHA
ncbi:DUF58 domain-containing protein [Aliikangiella marina]|uniref:DUF58 domain-containing protein n=1 Tax=Aliikangiella marina TaxID=1712262 RepID=UPI00163DB8BF|nr:DUF58 domain-containing protein [Aliikangiella marina]